MRTIRTLLLLPGLLALAGCGAGDEVAFGGAPPATTTYHVDGQTGHDGAAGTEAAPFRSITHALSVAGFGDEVLVRPGIYAAALTGEAFPLVIPNGVALIGDEVGGAAGAPAVQIVGAGFSAEAVVNLLYDVGVILGAASTFAGFHYRFPANANVDTTGIWIPSESPAAIVRNCHIDGAGIEVDVDGVTVLYPVVPARIEGCLVTQCTRYGILAAGRSAVEGNTVRDNRMGVIAQGFADLGGGAAGSAGGNVLQQNEIDLVLPNGHSGPVYAIGNTWDAGPPTMVTAADPPWGIDIWIWTYYVPGSVVLGP